MNEVLKHLLHVSEDKISRDRDCSVSVQCGFIRLKNSVDFCYKKKWWFTEGELDKRMS